MKARLDWRRLAIAAAGLCCAMLGAATLASWCFHLDARWAQAMPNAAIGLLLNGLALPAIAFGRRRLALVGAFWSLLLGTATLAEYLFSIDLYIDTALVRNLAPSTFPGRIGPNVAFCFVLSGIVLGWAASRRPRWQWIGAVGLFSGVVLATGLISLFGRLMGLPTYGGWSLSTPRVGALDAAMGFSLLGAAFLLLIWLRQSASESGFSPRLIVSVASGGLIVALCFGQALSSLNLDRTSEIARVVRMAPEQVRAVTGAVQGNLPLILAGIGLLVTVLMVLMANQTLASRRLAHASQILAGKLAGEVAERQGAEEEVRQLNASLERRVAERTAELVSVNRELEAFSYSVSHDLRTPLRALDGYSALLCERSGDQLDDEAKTLLARIRAASQRMGRLIEGILSLSRISRRELQRTTVDLSAVAQEVARELRDTEPARQVEFVIAPGILVCADANLLRVVLENLQGNAWKFTGKHPHGRIEVGVVQRDAGTAYFVRDDGAGFDMAYSRQLFGAFQRLHSTGEFPGTGIGLATVHRVVTRHGGRIWAEAEVEKGACFFFTLPPPPAMRSQDLNPHDDESSKTELRTLLALRVK